MKKLIIMSVLALLMVLSLISCGKVTNNKYYPPTTNNPEPTEDVDLSGYYVMPLNGYLELVKLNDGRYLIYQQQILSENTDGSLAYHTTIGQGPFVLQPNNTIVFAGNITYVAATNNIKTDVGNWNVTGSRRTEVIIGINEETGKLEYSVTIRADATLIGDIQVDRIIEEE